MAVKKHWHIIAILAAVVAGAVVLLWPSTAENPAEPAPGEFAETAAAQDRKAVAPGVTAASQIPADGEASSPAAGPSEFTQRAMNARAVGDIETAIALFEQAIAADPADALALTNYGRLLTLTLSLERAIEVLEMARDLRPADAQAWLDLATAYERAQRFRESRLAQAEAQSLVGAEAITRDEQGRFVVAGTTLD